MKDTGIVRRIDELGRIVIPKEIRRTLQLHVGTQMEIYIQADQLVLKKFSPLVQLGDIATLVCQSVSDGSENGVLICDTDTVLACNNVTKKDYLNKTISSPLQKHMFERKTYLLNVSDQTSTYPIIENDKNVYVSEVIVPIIANSDVMGALVVMSTKAEQVLTPAEVKTAQTVGNILARMLE